jgi:hypothetical protein
MQELTLKQSISGLSDQIQAMEQAHNKASETTLQKDAYFKSIETAFIKSDHTLGMILELMGYSSKDKKNVYDRGLEIGVLNSTRNWMRLMDMREILSSIEPAEAIDFFLKDFNRIVKPTFRELESKAKDYAFFQKNKKK